MKTEEQNQCPEFPHFGAIYPDARCIDGYLWDLDKFEDGKLYGGGEDPCPFCNTEEYIENHLDKDSDPPVTRERILEYIQKLRDRYDTPNKPNMNAENQVPRRIRLDLNTPAELAIYNAMQEVEKVGADVRLTDCVIMLSKAKDLLSDYVDEKLKGEES